MSFENKSSPGINAAIPDLRIVPSDRVLAHEEHDHQRSDPLIERIQLDGVWLNPPIVTPIPPNTGDASQYYAILDGANRCYSVRALGYPHILVQVVDYQHQVTLETWNHILSDAKLDDFLPQIAGISGLHMENADLETAQNALDLETAIAYLHLLPDRYTMLVAEQQDIHTRSEKLRQVVNSYKRVARLHRIDHEDTDIIRRLYPTACAVVVFPAYRPADILDAAITGHFLPPGISRHIISGRAMRLNYPLEALQDATQSLEEKNAALVQWMQERAAQKRIRLYEEATFIFDD